MQVQRDIGQRSFEYLPGTGYLYRTYDALNDPQFDGEFKPTNTAAKYVQTDFNIKVVPDAEGHGARPG